jgi:hypothetical protein
MSSEEVRHCRRRLEARKLRTVELVPWIAVTAIVIAGTLLAARRVAAGDRRFVWVFGTPALIGFVVVLWAGLRAGTDQPLLAIGLAVIAVPSIVLMIRRLRYQATHSDDFDRSGNLGSPAFDYIIWTAVGVPFLFAGLLVLLLITGDLASP